MKTNAPFGGNSMRSPASHCRHAAESSKVDVPEPWCSGDITTYAPGSTAARSRSGGAGSDPCDTMSLATSSMKLPADPPAAPHPISRGSLVSHHVWCGAARSCRRSERFDDEASNPILELFFEASNPRLKLRMAGYGGSLYCHTSQSITQIRKI